MLSNQLERARAIDLPTREAMLQRAPSVQQFWDNNKGLFSEAWKEWEASAEGSQLDFDDSLLDARLREAVREAWQDPTKEIAVKTYSKRSLLGCLSFSSLMLNVSLSCVITWKRSLTLKSRYAHHMA